MGGATIIPRSLKLRGMKKNFKIGQKNFYFENHICSARDWDGKDYLRIIPRVVW
jgi:hypothetical protein